MKTLKSFKLFLRKRNPLRDGVKCGLKKKQIQLIGVICVALMFILVQFRGTPMDDRFSLFDSSIEESHASWKLNNLPRGIIEARSDLELRPLWSSSIARLKIEASGSKVKLPTNRYLLAMPVGLKQKENVDTVVQKFLPVNFTIMLFHYDGKVDGWNNLAWSSKAIHVVAQNQTKWWFAKRFLHPSVVAAYDYIFLWDEDLDVKHFQPGSYLKIVKSEGLEISQPALDPNSTEIHHRITIRARTKKVHRRVYDVRGSVKCTNASWGPPCTGFVEGMAPVFTRAAWLCTWHLLQNDLVYGWGLDMKLGYCAQGDRTKKVGVVDSEYVTHKGIQTLGGGGPSGKKGSNTDVVQLMKKHASPTVDVRAEIRRQSTWELRVFKKRWNKAVDEDRGWVDPFPKGPITRGDQRVRKQRRRRQHRSRI